jgi:hypothetical protein
MVIRDERAAPVGLELAFERDQTHAQALYCSRASTHQGRQKNVIGSLDPATSEGEGFAHAGASLPQVAL